MTNRLAQNQLERVNKRYHEHPLFRACQATFQQFLAEMHYLMFTPTEVFAESAEVIDEILEGDSDGLDYIHNLWQDRIIRYKMWPLVHPGANDDTEYETAVTSVFYTVAVVLSRHADSYYNEKIKDALLEEINKHLSAVKQNEDFVIVNLSKYAESIEQWLETYATSDYYLSDEIGDVANGRTQISLIKSKTEPESRKADKKPITRRRKTWEGEDILHSFSYVTKSMPAEEKNKRLSLVFRLLHKRYISHTEMNTFINIFSGVDTSEYIVWKGYIVELQYFIGTLIDKELITWRRPGPGKWQIVCARFRLEHDVDEGESMTNCKHYSKIIDPLEPSQFNKIPKENKLTEHNILDKIISILIEESDSAKINREVTEMFSNMEMSEKEAQNKQSQVRKIDY